MRRWGAVALVAVGAFGAVACGSEPSAVLEPSDVPGASSSQEVTGPSRLMQCQAVPEAEYVVGLRDASLTVRLELEGGGAVLSTVADASGPGALAPIDEAIDECVAENGSQGTQTTRLDGLPDGVVGYEARSTSSPDDTLASRLWTVRDGRAVGVGLTSSGDDAPDVDLQALLEKAVERSEDFETE